MNKQRRKALGVLQDRLIALKVDDVLSELNDISNELTDLKDEEESAVENMIDGQRKDDAQEGVNNLEAACEYVSSLIEAIESENPVSLIDEARGFE